MMNELFDKLILRIFFTIFTCLVLYAYKFAHTFLYPSTGQQILKRFYPSKNPADTIHLIARLIGVGMILSEFSFSMSDGILFAMMEFFLRASMAFFIYLASIYIIESIVLYNFEYHDEILKRKNMAYAVISFAQSISLAYLLKIILPLTRDPVLILFLWLFAMVIIGFATKTYKLLSKLSFNKLLVQKNMAVAYSYAGFIWGWTFIIGSCMDHELKNIKIYAIKVILKILLSALIFPIFKKGLVIVFRIKEDFEQREAANDSEKLTPELGFGIYEGAMLLAASFLTSIITGHIHFGTFYPVL